ncbi:FtsX-like permease family protein [Candidatus Bathyarchaeota archaeon]|nr:FtsX-like permease family protein [Candidatus Bathyarchaeota archaeon]
MSSRSFSLNLLVSIFSALLLLVLLNSYLTTVFASENLYIQVNAFDAIKKTAIKDATIMMVDNFGNKLVRSTDDSGLCIFPCSFGYSYHIYAYKGNFETMQIEYAPNKRAISVKSFEPIIVDMPLVPGAVVVLEGNLYLVELPNPRERAMEISLVKRDPSYTHRFISEYGRSNDAFYLGLGEKIAIIPAGTPIDLLVRTSVVLVEEKTGIPRQIYKEFYVTDVDGSSFILSQGDIKRVSISLYSLRKSIEDVRRVYEEVVLQVSEAQKFGFMVFEERRTLTNEVYQRIIEAERLLQESDSGINFERAWLLLREALSKVRYTSKIIEDKFLISETNTVYISAVMAMFSIILAFFFFENEKRKIISSLIFYVILLITLYLTYPGAHIILDKNVLLFIQSSIPSFALFLFIVFGLPRIWKERGVEGEVSWRSAISIIFSMGKREIKRKRTRGFFTILSICILILCFTSLTSFGTAFGVVSERINVAPPSSGVIMIRRGTGDIPLGYGDIYLISSRVAPIVNVSLRLKNPPSLNPLARIRNPLSGKEMPIFGVLAISPFNEKDYTGLDEATEGGWLSEEKIGEVLIGSSMASILKVGLGENVILEILGTPITINLIIKGLINDQQYSELLDVNGEKFGPLRLTEANIIRTCNSTEIIVLNLKTAEFIQDRIEESKSAVIFLSPSEIVFRFADNINVEETAKKLVQLLSYEVFVSSNNFVMRYYIGVYIETKGVAELLIPLIMVILNTTMVMINSAYERSREIRVLSTLGLNPTHIGLTFVAEATILGMVGGSIGYVAGLGFFRIMLLFGQDLMVREKLEWWWSALGFALAIIVSLISVTRPAIMAINAYTPSRVKRIKRTEEEKVMRKEEIFKVYQARDFSMPLKVSLSEKDFFINFFIDSLKEVSTGYMERVENIEEKPEIENLKKEIIKEIRFDYYSGTELSRGTRNTLVMTKSPSEEYYRVKLISEPIVAGAPETVIERTVDFVQSIILTWVKNKKKIMGA